MDKLDRGTLKKKIYTLKKDNKKDIVNIVPENEKQIQPKRRSVIKIDTFSNICNGSNPKKFFKIKQFITPDVFNIYIFIGSVNPDIKTLIEKINGNFEKMNSNDKNKIIKNFINNESHLNDKLQKRKIRRKNYIEKLFNTKNESGGRVEFIYDLINYEDNISLVKKKIFVYLSSKTDFFIPEIQHLWIHTESKLHPKEIYNIFLTISENKEEINPIEVIKKLSIITGKDEKYIEKYLNLEDGNINYESFLYNKKIITLLLKRVNILGYKYQNKYGNININVNPFTSLSNDSQFINSDGSKKDLSAFKDNFKIINEYSEISDNTIYLVSIKDVINYIKSGDYFDGDLDFIYNGFLKKYWPYVDHKKIFNEINFYDEKGSQIYSEIKDNIVKREKSTNMIFDNYPQAQADISYDNCGLLLTVIHINFPGGEETVNIEKIFNNIELNKDIPFIKYKSDNSYETKYKIYKGVAEIQENGKPYISEKRINSWRKNIVVEKEGKTKITGVPKGLSIKHILYEDNGEYKFCTINILKDAKIEMKLYWTENMSANLLDIKDAVNKCKDLINKINKINISITNNPYYKIPLPDPNFIMKNKLETNTHIIFMNTSISLTLPPDLELNNIIDIVKCFYSYVSIIDEKQNLKKKILHLRFKRISNYEKMSNIDTFINRKHQELEEIEGKDSLIIQLIKQNFNKTKDEATKIYVEWTNQVAAQQKIFGGQKFFEIKQDPGTDIKIQKSLSNNIYKIMIEGVKNIDQLRRINNFLRCIIYFYKQDDKKKKGKLLCQDFKDIEEKEEYDYESSDKKEKDTLGELKEKSQIITKEGFEFDSDSSSDSDSEEENMDSDQESDEKLLSESDSISESEQDTSSEKIDIKEFQFDKEKSLLRPIREYSLKRLYDADPELFKYETNKKYQAYSTICGEVDFRQPIVISKRNKEIIDKNHPGSYNHSLEYGSKGRKNIYICPKYWCVNCETSLTEEEVYNVKEIYSSIINKITKRDTIYIKGNIKEIEKIIPNSLQDDKNRVLNNNILLYVKDQKIGNIKITVLPDKNNFVWKGGMEKIKKDITITSGDQLIFKQKSDKPCCPICKGEIIPKSKDLPKKENQSILVRESSYFTPQSTPYPGFLGVHQHPEGLCMPCCFKKWDTHLNKSRRDICLSPGKTVDQDIKLKNERYIKNADKFPLELNKIGMLPKILNNFLGNDVNKMLTKGKSGLLNEGVAVFLRKGIEQSQNNSFLRAISHIHNPMWNHRKEDEFIEKQIIKNLNPELFSKLNNGNLVIIFKDNYNLNEKNLENFVNWCLNNRIFIEKNQLQEILDIQLRIEDIDKWEINKKQILFRIHNIYTAIINFESYLLSNSVKNEEYLWDLVSREDVVFKKGINLIIFSRNNNEDIEDIHIICPQGLSPSLVFDNNKKTAFIIKMGKYYEPIERIAFKSGKADIINTFTFSNEEENKIIKNILINIEKIFIENCNILSNEKYMSYKEKNNINFQQYDAINTYNKIKNITLKDFVVIFQIVDYYNKVKALILKKGTDKNDNEPTFIPVKPSSIISDVPILTDIISFKFKNLISTYISLNGIHNILSTSQERRLNCKPIKLIKKNNLITGIQTINSSIIPIHPNENLNDKKYNELTILLESVEDNKKDIEQFLIINPEFITLFENKWDPEKKILSSINKENILLTLKRIINMETVDINLIKDYDQQFTSEEKFLDERIKYMNKMYFENETYERIKFEISKFLQLSSRKSKIYKKIIYDIVNDSITDFEAKRENLKKYITEIILSIAEISESKDIEKEYNFKLERLRVKCNNNTNQSSCNQKQHCIWEKNILKSGENIAKSKKNKLKKTYPQVYEKYSSKLNEDIITQGIFLASKNINKIREDRIKKSDSALKESLILTEIDTTLENYIDKSYEETLRKENEIIGGKCKLYINKRNLIDNKINIEKYSSLIVEEILRNKIKRREILEGLFSDIIENTDIKENDNEIILSDEDLNSGKLKKIYEKKFDLFIKNKDVVNYEIIDGDSTNPLPAKIQNKLKYNFRININNKKPNNLLECFTIIANKLTISYLKKIISKEYLYPGKFNSNIIRNIFIEKVNKLGNIKEKKNIPFWKHLINSYLMDNSKDIKEISSFKIFEEYIKENNHWYNEQDLSVLHNIFKINIITLNRKNKENSGFNINYNEEYNYYVLLYCTKIENTNKIKYEIISLNEKYIFNLEDFAEEFQELIISSINVDKEILLKKPKHKAKILDERVIISRKKKKSNL